MEPIVQTNELEFVGRIIADLTGDPLCYNLERSVDEKGVLIVAYVDYGHLGRVIGKNGSTAQSIRTLLRALGLKNDARYSLKIEERVKQ